MISVLHAYSDVNRGDAYLVSATVDRIRRTGYAGPLTIVSLDPAAFGEFGDVVPIGTTRSKASGGVATAALGSALSVAARRTPLASRDRLSYVLQESDALIGVGGGYLDCSGPSRQLGVAVNHLPQLLGAAQANVPTMYMPQSIGPLNGPVGRIVRRSLARIDRLWVRDPESMEHVQPTNVERCADLAVLNVAENRGSPAAADGSVMLIARRLVHDGDYVHRLDCLARRLPDAVWAVQAGGPPEKSDAAFYEELGVRQIGGEVETVLTQLQPVVVSVRLHGSLMALMDGLPTVHLAYEPKGTAAMHDLGLGEWVHPARTFDPDVVANQVDELIADPTRYWDAIERTGASLRSASARLDLDLARAIS